MRQRDIVSIVDAITGTVMPPLGGPLGPGHGPIGLGPIVPAHVLAGACGPLPMLERPLTIEVRGRRCGRTAAAARRARLAELAAGAAVPATATAMRSVLEAADAGALVEPEAHDRYARAAYARAHLEELLDDANGITDRGRRMLAILGGTPRPSGSVPTGPNARRLDLLGGVRPPAE